MNAPVRAIMGPLVFAFLLLAWWFDHRGFLHGMAFIAQVWWLWSIRPRRSANADCWNGGESCRVVKSAGTMPVEMRGSTCKS